MVGSHIYILGSHPSPLYIGVTSNLSLRVVQQDDDFVRVLRFCGSLKKNIPN
jgi:predicted GIY-YIG superfamily endonuclease